MSTTEIGLGNSDTDQATVASDARGRIADGQRRVLRLPGEQCPDPGRLVYGKWHPGGPGEALVAWANDNLGCYFSPITPTTTGTWRFSAVYIGDFNYSGAEDNTGGDNFGPNESVYVAMAA